MKKRNILDPDEIRQDQKRSRRQILDHLKKYEHLKLPGQDRLRETFRPDLSEAAYYGEEEEYEDNPRVESWAYRGITRDEFEDVAQEGIKTEYNRQMGRGVLFTCDPTVAFARKGEGGQVVRFPFPEDADMVVGHGPYQYEYFVYKRAIKRGELEVFLSGDVDDPDSWIPVGALR